MRLLLIPLSFLFRIGVFFRNAFYNTGIFKVKQLNTKIISVGNIAAGGTGKTPFVELIAKYLLAKNKFVVIILKGYKREHDDIKVVEVGFQNEKHELSTESLGDEAFLFLENLTDENGGRGLIVVGDDKTKAAKFASTKFKPEVIIIDDGFQHRKLGRDLDIVILNPGHGQHMIPAGNLREPLKNIHRADLVISNNKFDKTAIAENTKGRPRVICSYEFEGFLNIKNENIPGENNEALAFCGIGEPDSFKELLKQQNVTIKDFLKFPDHHNYSNDDIKKILDSFNRSGAKYILTTQKDFVRIKNSELVLKSKSENSYKILLYNYPLYYAKIKMQINHNEELLYDELDDLIRAI
jgi:tetraacyldisaccharide 4'-kinase